MKKLYLLLGLFLVGCVGNPLASEESERADGSAEQVGGKQQTLDSVFTLSVASRLCSGVAVSCGIADTVPMYAVKSLDETVWRGFGGSQIQGFVYEAGSEYLIKLRQQNFLDWSQSDPAWSEYTLLEVVSKERKESSGLPTLFLDGRNETYSEHTLLVASKQLIGLNGPETGVLDSVLAVKYLRAEDWKGFVWGTIKGFVYRPGYEYELQVAKRYFVDFRMGTPAWSEYELLNVVSQTPKYSEGLPTNDTVRLNYY